ncbi:DUF4365 domain-containing protein [Arthrobacter sedimenti]|uniref:DUF4365 domain-containing protein n=1 Tax=Arthrobacter sedimenti TaxID=2694931 RepID=A0ABV8WP12_9MICC
MGRPSHPARLRTRPGSRGLPPCPGRGGKQMYQTWGEHLYLQVKTTDKFKFSKHVEDDRVTPVLKFSIETAELKLVEAMGASVPVVLLVVDRADMKLFYVCLNDYISKKLAVSSPTWRDQQSITLYIPIRNEIRVTDEEFDGSSHWGYFARLAQRSKIYSAANLTHHYSVELEHASDKLFADEMDPTFFGPAAADYIHRVETFTNEVAELDIWRKTDNEWAALENHRQALNELKERTANLKAELKALDGPPESLLDSNFFLGRLDFLSSAFRTLSLLGREYEQTARLERLPGGDPFASHDEA